MPEALKLAIEKLVDFKVEQKLKQRVKFYFDKYAREQKVKDKVGRQFKQILNQSLPSS